MTVVRTTSYELPANEAQIRQHQGWAALLSNGNMALENYPQRHNSTDLSPWQSLLAHVERTPALYIKQLACTRGATTQFTQAYDPYVDNGIDGLLQMVRATRTMPGGSWQEQAIGVVLAKYGIAVLTLMSLDGRSIRGDIARLDDVWAHSTLRKK